MSTNARWHVLVAGFLCYGFDAVDFMVLALALPAIINEWHLSLSQAGLLGTAGMIGVGLSSLLLGRYADNHGRRRALVVSVLTFALFTGLIALSRNRFDVMALRFFAGIGLGGTWGVVAALVNETWPPQSRGRAAAFVLSAWPVGVSAAALLAGALLPGHGWRPLFAWGGAAVIAALYVQLFVPESTAWRQQRSATRAAGAASDTVKIGEIFSPTLARRTWLGTLAAACALIGYWGTNTWLPTYLIRERGLDAATMANFVVMLNVGMFIGYQLLGWLADRIGQRRALLWCFAGATLLLPIYAAIRDNRVLFWMGPILALFFAYTGPLGSYFPALYPTRVRSMGAGFCFNVGRGVAAFAPYALGALASHIGLSLSIALCAVGFGLSGLVMLLLPDNPGVEPPTRSGEPALLMAGQPQQADIPVPASGK
jgi:MFS family permease